MRRAGRQRGFLLLYVVGLLAAIALLLSQVGRMRADSPEFLDRQMQAAIQSREARQLIEFAIAGMGEQKLPVDPRYVQFRRLIVSNPAVLSEIEDQLSNLKAMLASANFNIDLPGEGGVGSQTETTRMLPHDGSGVLFGVRKEAYRVKLGDTEYEVRVIPGNALPNLNAIDFAALRRYLIHLKFEEEEARELAANLIDWRDGDDFRSDGIGAERDYYLAQAPPILPRNAPFRSWQELAYVKGVTPDRLFRLREALVIGAPSAHGLSPDYATPEAIAALSGLRLEVARAILAEYGKIVGDRKDVPESVELVLSEDAAAFDRVVNWQIDKNLVRIEVGTSSLTRTVEYDVKAKRIVAAW